MFLKGNNAMSHFDNLVSRLADYAEKLSNGNDNELRHTTISHYDYLNQHLNDFLRKMTGRNEQDFRGMIAADGDKCYSYQNMWENNGIHFYHGCMLYMLGRVHPFCETVRNTTSGWVAPDMWVVQKYRELKQELPEIS